MNLYSGKVRPFGKNPIPNRPWMALITAEYVSQTATMQWADFKDTHALKHPASDRFVGLTNDGHMFLGNTNIEMMNGLWYIEMDLQLVKKYKDIPAMDLVLSIIR